MAGVAEHAGLPDKKGGGRMARRGHRRGGRHGRRK